MRDAFSWWLLNVVEQNRALPARPLNHGPTHAFVFVFVFVFVSFLLV